MDEKYMRMALKLAQRGIGSVEPNPAVGAVLVKANQIIGRGWHRKFGEPHAEINALVDCRKLAFNPQGATMYVTLEPCCHFGKTPPCTKAIIKSGIRKIVAATKDPTKKVNGKGFKILKNAGIEVKTDVCKKEAQLLNAPFFKFAKTKKPWVIIKWAQSKDGFLARTDKKRWITCAKSRKDAQGLRKKVQAILVGVNTVLADDPMLTARPDTGKQPLRVVLDSQLKIPLNCNLIKTVKKAPVVVFTTRRGGALCRSPTQKNNKKIPILKKKGVEVIAVSSTNDKCSIEDVLTKLGKRDIQQILVEGGEKIITSFLKRGLADQIVIYTSHEKLAKRGKVKASREMKKTYHYVKNNYYEKKRFDTDICLKGFTK
jgi:diaminohydroxyphosphoribosylaminopyrimidine deaminase/5-amino-6-(5-phosphoribosylamino)uracil reductase